MQATSGATLELLNGNFTNSASGVIKAGDTSSVLVSGSLVSGGTLETAGSGVVHFTGGSELGTITSTGALQVDTNQALFLANGSTLTNQGTLTLAGSAAELRTVGGGTATLAGGGTVFLGGDGNNLIRDASSATGSITNQDNTIHGAGNIGDGQLSFDNQASGTITADNSAHALVLQPNNSGFSNEGLMQSTSAPRSNCSTATSPTRPRASSRPATPRRSWSAARSSPAGPSRPPARASSTSPVAASWARSPAPAPSRSTPTRSSSSPTSRR